MHPTSLRMALWSHLTGRLDVRLKRNAAGSEPGG